MYGALYAGRVEYLSDLSGMWSVICRMYGAVHAGFVKYLSGLSGIWSAIYGYRVRYMPDAWCEYLSAS